MPEPILRPITDEDIPDILALSEQDGIGQGLDHDGWKMLIDWTEGGSYCLVDGDRLIAMSLAFYFQPDRAWLGGVMTHPYYRRRGLGSRITRATMDFAETLGARHIFLYASEKGYSVYEKIGFREVYLMESRRVEAEDQPGPYARLMEADELAEVIALDTATTGMDRSRTYRYIISANENANIWVDDAPGGLAGFMMIRTRGEERVHIGPLIHKTPEGADKLVRTALHTYAGRKVSIAIPDRNAQAIALAERYTFTVLLRQPCMVYGDESLPNEDIDAYYSIFGRVTG